jgi:hypothetical protein
MSSMSSSIEDLIAYIEADMIATVPINDPRICLMSAQLVHLLSYWVAEDQTLLTYAESLCKLYS